MTNILLNIKIGKIKSSYTFTIPINLYLELLGRLGIYYLKIPVLPLKTEPVKFTLYI